MDTPHQGRVGLYRRVGTGCADVEPAELCSTCLACLQETAEPEEIPHYFGDEQFRHHRSLDALGRSVHQGCTLCLMLWRKLEESCPLDLISTANHTEDQRIVEYRVSCRDIGDDKSKFVGMGLTREAVSKLTKGEMEIEVSIHVEFVTHESLRAPKNVLTSGEGVKEDDYASQEVVSSVPTATSTSDDNVLALASKWLAECSAHHLACQNHDLDIPWLPLRLVEIRSTPGSDCSFRCVETSTTTVSPQRFLTLSYRWGRSKGLQLSSSTRQALGNWTDARALPKTLREVLDVCAYLKISYIWIDRLCIIQDDPQDWIGQAAQMGKIYANAYCNIAASVSEDDGGGLFRSRDPHDLALLHYYRDVRSGGLEDSFLLDLSLWLDRVTEAPLNQRAWVFQERLLSRRTLHFSKDQLLWECRDMTATETFPRGIKLRGITKQRDLFQYPRYWESEQRNSSCVDLCPICSGWYRDLVGPFTESSITYADDRPLAFAGIGKMVSENIGDTYVAGMLGGHLRKQLLWAAIDTMNRPSPPAAAVLQHSHRDLPSFSWLSLDCEIHHNNYNGRPEKKYLFQIDEVDVGPFLLAEGQLRQAGKLRLSGYLMQIHLIHTIDTEGRDSWTLQKPDSNLRTNFTESHAQFWKENEGSYLQPFIWPDWTRKDLPLCSQGTEHYLMLAAVESWIVFFLILEKSDRAGDAFRRIGICGIHARIDQEFLEALGIDKLGKASLEVETLTQRSITIV